MIWGSILSALLRVIVAVLPFAATWFAAGSRARTRAENRRLEAETAAKQDAIEVRDEVDQMDDDAVRDRLGRWMRDR